MPRNAVHELPRNAVDAWLQLVLMSCEGNTCCKMMPWQKTWPWALAALDGEKLSLYRAFLVCCEHALALAWARPTSNWFQRCIFSYTLYMNLHTYTPVYLPTCIPRYLLTYLPVHTYIPSYLHTYISHTNTPTYLTYLTYLACLRCLTCFGTLHAVHTLHTPSIPTHLFPYTPTYLHIYMNTFTPPKEICEADMQSYSATFTPSSIIHVYKYIYIFIYIYVYRYITRTCL